ANTVAPNGAFHSAPSRIASGFEGPLALVVARGKHEQNPLMNPLRILVPVTGTEASRRAAELAIAIARANHVPITALYVVGGSDQTASSTRRNQEVILKDIVELGER